MEPKILLLDIETSPILGYVWGLWENNLALNQIEKDWHILSFSAKWLKDPDNKIIYMDQRNIKKIEDDSKLLKVLWQLLDETDIVITQNGKSFDIKKINARFIISGMKPPSSFRQIDTLLLAKKHFGFTSNKLEYMSESLCKKYKKSKHKKFAGFDMWLQCLKGNKEAWKEMEKYNKLDVLALQELYLKMQPWDNTNLNIYSDDLLNKCSCGNIRLKKNGFAYTSLGKFQRWTCSECGHETRDRKNLLTKEKNKSLQK